MRVLINLGEHERAYAVVEAVLAADPEFVDSQDFREDTDYLRWRRRP